MGMDQGGGARIGTHPVVEDVVGEAALEPPPSGSMEGGHVASTRVFVLGWSLSEGARLSNYQTALEFTQHAFPPGTRLEMGSYSPADLVGSLRYAAAQSACFFGESANRLEQMLAANADRPSLQQELDAARAEVVKHEDLLKDLRSQVASLQAVGEEAARLREQLSVLGQEKVELQDVLAERDRVAQAKTQALEEVEADLSWLLTNGVVGVVDLVIESRDFGIGVHRLKEVCMAAGQAQDEAVDAFMNVDYATAFKLGELGVPDLKALLDPGHVAGPSQLRLLVDWFLSVVLYSGCIRGCMLPDGFAKAKVGNRLAP
ncbi:hypothetical protein L2E82_39062 [Cichorium intybus]|uniref:Uncharacterized protein n=1 Tax=Cichorium intybus TaxID=13427 RepID=A0ACB9AHG2_CICIN|nr:hypothetical protein L2E82_39062 [Cichorium intybus]